MLFIVALVLIAAGALLVFRGRALLHWRRGYRDLSRFQRTWMVKGAAARRLRIRGAVLVLVGLAAAAAALTWGQGAPIELASAWAP
ncbi:MAG: hypothetical protein ABUS48_04240 [Pseudomonadota bacterium]